jgi:tripartite-type tricarboxylate transporter receptor subunit TctC
MGNAMEFRRRRFLRLTGAAVAGLFASPLAWAEDYPARPVTIVVPFTPGGRPGQLSFASVGPGVPHHLYAELLMSTAGIAMTHVPYKGSAPALNDVVAGHIPLMFCDIPPAIGMLQAGKVRPLGVTTRTRVPALPNVPPIAEAGLPEFGALPGWHMMVAPGKTPRDVVAKLHAELLDILALPEIETEILRLGMLPFENRSIEGLQDFVKSETVRWGKVVQQAGIAGSE